MGLSLTIQPKSNAAHGLGDSSEVTAILAKHFAAFKPVVERNRGEAKAAASFLRSMLPRAFKWALSGPTSEKVNVAHVDEDGYVVEFMYDHEAIVRVLYLTLYGQTAAADTKLSVLCEKQGWVMRY